MRRMPPAGGNRQISIHSAPLWILYEFEAVLWKFFGSRKLRYLRDCLRTFFVAKMRFWTVRKKTIGFLLFFSMLRRHNQIVGKFIEDFRNFIAERYGENRSKVGLEQNALKLSQNRPKSYQKREVKFSGHHLVSLRPLIPLTQFIADPNSPLWK